VVNTENIGLEVLTNNYSLHLTRIKVSVTKINIIRNGIISMQNIKTTIKNKDLKKVKVKFKAIKAHMVNFKRYSLI
jgi:hypothetical protein